MLLRDSSMALLSVLDHDGLQDWLMPASPATTCTNRRMTDTRHPSTDMPLPHEFAVGWVTCGNEVSWRLVSAGSGWAPGLVHACPIGTNRIVLRNVPAARHASAKMLCSIEVAVSNRMAYMNEADGRSGTGFCCLTSIHARSGMLVWPSRERTGQCGSLFSSMHKIVASSRSACSAAFAGCSQPRTWRLS